MNYSSLKHNYLLLASVILVFYPAKGLLNLSYNFFQKPGEKITLTNKLTREYDEEKKININTI